MNTKNIVLLSVLAFILILGGCACNGYNSLVGKDENVKAKWSNVESDYQRRSDLIPNLVNTVKGAANFEQQTLTQVVQARARATSITIDPNNVTPEKLAEFQQAQAGVSSALGRLLAVAENYPDLKASQNFRDLQQQLEGTENRIKVSRNDYNAAVQEYNTTARRFPTVLYAGFLGFTRKSGFAAEAGAEKAPEVKF
ncbi:MAG: LemA family protein [Chitinophagaceae bacterium]